MIFARISDPSDPDPGDILYYSQNGRIQASTGRIPNRFTIPVTCPSQTPFVECWVIGIHDPPPELVATRTKVPYTGGEIPSYRQEQAT